jgi:hypothetical protein
MVVTAGVVVVGVEVASGASPTSSCKFAQEVSKRRIDSIHNNRLNIVVTTFLILVFSV